MKQLCIMLLAAMVSLSTGQTADKKGVKVGMTIQDLSNPVWAGYCQALQKKIGSMGGNLTYVSCESNAGKQITQIENFVSSGVDVLIVHPADPAGVEAACKQARDKGIKVISWDDDLKNADIAWLIDNHKLGYTIGEAAAKFINDKLGGKAEVAILNYPQLPILLERGNGIKEAITKLAPNATIVAETSAINPAEGISKMETIFQGHPNVKVVGCIGGGGSVGANEAAKAAGKIKDDFGIFAADATKPELSAMKNNEGVRMSVAVGGTLQNSADTVWGLIEQLESGKPIETKEVYRILVPVTKENVEEFLHPK
jgi:ribose transport system substrate-binding protein